MTANEFCLWLAGRLQLDEGGPTRALTKEAAEVIAAKLRRVFASANKPPAEVLKGLPADGDK